VSTLAPVPVEAGFDRLIALVTGAVSSDHSKRAYHKALSDFLNWWVALPVRPPLSKALVQDYTGVLRQRLAPSSINVRLAAIRKLASEAADNGLLAPELAAGIAKVRGAKRLGVRAGNWLTREQAGRLIEVPSPSTLKGQRDRAILALLVACGLRRAELVSLEVGSFEQREARWVLPDLAGKGGRIRTVPVPGFVKARVDAWIAAAHLTEGPVFRSVGKGGVLKAATMDENAVWLLVEKHARAIGIPKLTPHDLRRTCAKLCRAAGGDIEQIQLLLGHASIQTTERYLGTRQNLVEAVNDRLGLIHEEPVSAESKTAAAEEEPEQDDAVEGPRRIPSTRGAKRRKRRSSSPKSSAAQLRRDGEFLDAVLETSRRFGLGVFGPAIAPVESSFHLRRRALPSRTRSRRNGLRIRSRSTRPSGPDPGTAPRLRADRVAL
jgi:integrase/recombinase XerD